MALRRLSTSSIQTNGKSSKLWDQTTFQSGMFALATVSLSTAASTVTFSGIPNNYTHLQLRVITRSSRSATSDGPIMRVGNGTVDPNANYSWHHLTGNGSAASANGFASQSQLGFGDIPAANATSGVFGTLIIDILDYANTSKFKTTRTLIGYDNNGSGNLRLTSGSWRGSSAIDIITLYPEIGPNFAANSHFALYGIKVA